MGGRTDGVGPWGVRAEVGATLRSSVVALLLDGTREKLTAEVGEGSLGR